MLKYMYQIIQEIEKGNLDTAIKWAYEYEKQLKSIDSDIIFNLHELKVFLEIY